MATKKEKIRKLKELKRKLVPAAKFLIMQLKSGERAVLGWSQRINKLISKIEDEIQRLESK